MFKQMVDVLKSYEGKKVCHSIPTQSEWIKANIKAIRNGTYKKSDSDVPEFRTEKRHYKKSEVEKVYQFK